MTCVYWACSTSGGRKTRHEVSAGCSLAMASHGTEALLVRRVSGAVSFA